ncbi:competence CoiA-like predicted nuclease [Peribacillus deserti]|uniref:Competence CoiA-like predicted nuclease n=1 Tax=Peribacillus deserti TaxID=673318 RepID=A0ABS2QMK6_9BACI|nr:competence protein CoiA family protein [Peribacillus deserti]MBM7693949.1 competence CoiA-like predicted nuclease [Peribacillus deserti]
MLTVKKEDGSYFSIEGRLKKEEVKKIKEKAPYFCPCCHKKVILKAGERRIPHFAHEKLDACISYSEPESEYHLNGKLILYKWLKDQGYEVNMEAYIKEINQKADLYFEVKDTRYVIEFQCSIIPQALYIKRTVSYQQAGIQPIWILGSKLIKQKRAGTFKLSSFEWLFAFNESFYPSILTFCPLSAMFLKLQSIISFSAQVSFAETKKLHLGSVTFHQLFLPHDITDSQLFSWIQKKRNWQFFSHRYAAIHTGVHRELYLKGLSPSTLPAFIGIPVPFGHCFETPSVEWQTYIYLDVLIHLKEDERFNIDIIENAIRKRLKSGEIRIRSLPLNKSDSAPMLAITAFLDLLAKAGLLLKLISGEYKILPKPELNRVKGPLEKTDFVILRELCRT